MAQKVNPISLRLQQTNRQFDNCWYSNYFYRKLVSRDIYLQQYINSFLKLVKFPSARFSIQYSTKNIKLYSFLCSPKIYSKLELEYRKSLPSPKKPIPLLSGIYWKKKKKFKKRGKQYNSRLGVKQNSRFSKHQKTFKFLVNSRLWSRISNPFSKCIKNSALYTNLLNKQLVKKNLVTPKSKQFGKNTQNSFHLTGEYKKNILKSFLFLYLLHTQYNNNTKTNQVNRKNLISSFSSFSEFQPTSLLYTTLQNNTPINYFLQQKSAFSSYYKMQAFWTRKNTKSLTIDILQNKKVIQKNPFSLYNRVKKDELQNLKYKNYLQNFLHSQFKLKTQIRPFIVKQDWQSAGFLADKIVYFLERRSSFRRLKQKIIENLTDNSRISGIRITCSGRVGGKSKKAQRAKTECLTYGQTSRHTFSSQLDFATRTARTIFGSVGIKVWICYK